MKCPRCNVDDLRPRIRDGHEDARCHVSDKDCIRALTEVIAGRSFGQMELGGPFPLPPEFITSEMICGPGRNLLRFLDATPDDIGVAIRMAMTTLCETKVDQLAGVISDAVRNYHEDQERRTLVPLAQAVLTWWDEHHEDEYLGGEGELFRQYNEEPELVKLARKVMEARP